MPDQADSGWLLAIDTSSDWAGIALTDGGNTTELNWNAGHRQTQAILPEIERLLATTGITRDQIAAVAVALGPGSFSGLRVGTGLAKGFSIATGIPIIGVSTLAVTVEPWRMTGQVIGVVKAGRSRFVWANAGNIEAVRTGRIEDLFEELGSAGETTVVGELGPSEDAALAGLKDISVPSIPARRRRAGVLAGIGWARWQSGDVDDLDSLEPRYIHTVRTAG